MSVRSAPYRVGDQVLALFSDGQGTVAATLTVHRIAPMAENGKWRISCNRPHPTCPVVEYVVDSTGRDRHRYVEHAP